VRSEVRRNGLEKRSGDDGCGRGVLFIQSALSSLPDGACTQEYVLTRALLMLGFRCLIQRPGKRPWAFLFFGKPLS
jgi:hypothetical protein